MEGKQETKEREKSRARLGRTLYAKWKRFIFILKAMEGSFNGGLLSKGVTWSDSSFVLFALRTI